MNTSTETSRSDGKIITGASLLPLLAIAALMLVSLNDWLAANETVAQKQLAKAQEHITEKKREEIAQRFNQGVMMLHARRYDHAATAFHRVIELAPMMPEAHVNMGFALLGSGNAGAAADFFNSAIELRPHQLNAYYGMAIAREALGDIEGAAEAMRAYLHRAPSDDPYRANAEAALAAWLSARENRQ